LAESQPDRVKILKKANVKKVIKDGEKVTGVDYEYQGKQVSWSTCRGC
jgi:alkyl hydroperoxide reductase subunit AhpF